MNQLIQELKLYELDSQQDRPRQDNMFLKTILDEPLFHNSGRLSLRGDSSSYYELMGVNYIWLSSNLSFNLILNDVVMINSSQFSYVNRYRRINISVQCNSEVDQKLEYVYGNLDLGDEAEALALTNPTCGAKWSQGLKNIVLTLDNTSAPPVIFPNISHLCSGLGG